MRRPYLVVVALALLAGGLTGCARPTAPAATRTVVDAAGVTVTIPARVDRIVNLWTSGVQLMVALGLGDHLAGVNTGSKSEWALYADPALAVVPEFGADVGAEALLATKADVVLLTDATKAADLRSKGGTAVCFRHFTLDTFRANVRLLGDIIGGDAAARAAAYVTYLDDTIREVGTALQSVTTPTRLYYIDGYGGGRSFYQTIGGGTINAETARAAHTVLVTEGLLDANATQVDAETVIAANPQAIIVGRAAGTGLVERLLAAPEWQSVTAVATGRVFTVPVGIAAWERYGAEIALMIPWLATTIYPTLYAPDMVERTRSFYQTFTGITLTSDQVRLMLAGVGPHG